eukprot:g7276.t1
MGVHPSLVSALATQEILRPTVVGNHAFRPILRGRDVILRAETGSGKTLAYLLPLVNHQPSPRHLCQWSPLCMAAPPGGCSEGCGRLATERVGMGVPRHTVRHVALAFLALGPLLVLQAAAFPRTASFCGWRCPLLRRPQRAVLLEPELTSPRGRERSTRTSLKTKLPFVRFLFPTAPTQPVTCNMGAWMPSWFDINSLEPDLFQLDPPGLKESAEQVRQLIQDDVDKIPVHFFHGEADPLVPLWWGRRSMKQLQAQGVVLPVTSLVSVSIFVLFLCQGMEDLPLETCFLVASLGLNVAALAPLSGSIYFNMSLTKAWYGEPTVARSILVSVYMSTVVASLCLICLLFLPNALIFRVSVVLMRF